MIVYVFTIFISAFLVFQIQPLISKCILPWFGSNPGVWTVCVLFFQSVLLLGYTYAHLVVRKLDNQKQAFVHIAVASAAILVLLLQFLSNGTPLYPSVYWRPTGTEDPGIQILLLLAFTVGIPYFVVSTTAPLLQSWFAKSNPGKSPYALYALSNVGSVLGLISYPFIIEPWLGLREQAWMWSILFVVFVAGCILAALSIKDNKTQEVQAETKEGKAEKPRAMSWFFWIILSAWGSLMLLSITNLLCMDVATIPFLFVIPLCLYLLSFIICFSSVQVFHLLFRPIFYPLLIIALGFIIHLMNEGGRAPLESQIFGYCFGLFACVMILHGELYRTRPHPQYLTGFFLAVSLGGALGGIFVGLIAPLVFSTLFEVYIGILGTAVLACCVLLQEHKLFLNRSWFRLLWAPIIVGMLFLSHTLALHRVAEEEDCITTLRNFYGVLRVKENYADEPSIHMRRLVNGITTHGCQFMQGEKRRWKTTYYDIWSGVGVSIERHPNRSTGIRIGMVGLGAGTTLAYGRKGDYIRVYDINPYDVKIAQEDFHYIKDCEANFDIVLGDARVSMQREAEKEDFQKFDVLALDAFSSDAIPLHLLTLESVQLYLQHLNEKGVLAIHISNRYLELSPVVFSIAKEINRTSDERDLEVIVVNNNPKEEVRAHVYPSRWLLVTRCEEFLNDDVVKMYSNQPDPEAAAFGEIRVWTDDYSNMFDVMRSTRRGR